MTVTGRPWDELEDSLTAPRLQALMTEWVNNPPVGDLVARYLDYKPPAPADVPAQDASDPSGIGSLVMQFPSGNIPAQR
jgi:hypothetical protein